MANCGELDDGARLCTLALPDSFIKQASPADMDMNAGLTVADIVSTVIGVVPDRPQLMRTS